MATISKSESTIESAPTLVGQPCFLCGKHEGFEHTGACLACLRWYKEDLNSRPVRKTERFYMFWKVTPYELKRQLNARLDI